MSHTWPCIRCSSWALLFLWSYTWCTVITPYQPKNNGTDCILIPNWIMQCVSWIFFPQREQPLLSLKAHVFQIDPATKRNWIPASKHAVTVSFFYDVGRSVYRIISVGGTKVRDHIYGRSNLNSISLQFFEIRSFCHFCDTGNYKQHNYTKYDLYENIAEIRPVGRQQGEHGLRPGICNRAAATTGKCCLLNKCSPVNTAWFNFLQFVWNRK